ncbi:MAG: carboxy terminal-processing peptidase [Chitinophagales bacterium]|nr:carboxy terminal-processing peptidase [Chitinophagales bacterium]
MDSKIIKKMILRSSVVIAALFGVYFLGIVKPQPQPIADEKEALILQGMLQAINHGHFNPKKIDDQMSEAVFDSYLEKLDSYKRFFTQKDIDILNQYKYQLDDQVKALSFEFFDVSLPLLDVGIRKAEKYFLEAIDGKIDFDAKGKYETDPEKIEYALDDAALKKRWEEAVHWYVMTNWVRSEESQKEIKDNKEIKTAEELKTEAIQDTRKKYVDYFDRMKKFRRQDRLDAYLKSICNYYDPHTDYFSPVEKQNFDINMGAKLEGIGARLQLEGDYTKVFSIVVGGPAWKTKKLEENDIIMKVAQKGQEPVDIAGMRLDDVVQLIRGKKGTTVILTVKKKDNSIVDISIERDEVQLDDSKAKSVLINIPDKIHNISYIYLPKFYSSFEADGGNSCATDVADEIKKLKDQHVNGIILDLRNNSGGSLYDVVEMSGFFIESGPIVQVKGREDKPTLYQDKDNSVLYDGPLVIMVNQYSASASEIIAAAMQDYDRALIVGSTTFGKGSVQRFWDLDSRISGYNDFKPFGSVKVTMQKFYRVNGGSTQLKGVTPDINLPDIYQFIEMGEKDYEFPMSWSEIEPAKYSQSVVLLENKKRIEERSKERVAQSEDFKLILEKATKLKEDKDKTEFPLDLDSYKAMVEQRALDDKKYENLFKNDVQGLVINNLPVDLQKIEKDESLKAKNDEFIKDLKKDVYLEETMYIIRDMINMEKSFVYLQHKILK